jgi:ankyrin repeat protein
MSDPNSRAARERFIMCGKTGNIDDAMLLITGGVDINVASLEKKCPFNHGTILHLAVQYGREELVRQLLLLPNININSVNMYKDTPFIAAVRVNRVRLVQMLLAHGDVDISHTSTWLSDALRIAKGTNNCQESARVIEEYIQDSEAFIEKYKYLLTTSIPSKPPPPATRVVWDGGTSSQVILSNWKTKDPNLSRPVTQYDLTGNIVRENDSSNEYNGDASEVDSGREGGSK